jgi:hypothetical protein
MPTLLGPLDRAYLAPDKSNCIKPKPCTNTFLLAILVLFAVVNEGAMTLTGQKKCLQLQPQCSGSDPVIETWARDWDPNQWVIPEPVIETRASDCNPSQWLRPGPVTESWASDWDLSQWLKSEPVTETWAGDWDLSQWLRLALCNGPEEVGTFPYLSQTTKHIQFLKCSALRNMTRRTLTKIIIILTEMSLVNQVTWYGQNTEVWLTD